MVRTALYAASCKLDIFRTVSSPMKRGLGRGLTSLIPGAEQIERASLTPQEQLFRNLVDAGLDLIDELVQPEISAYLHAPHDDDPILQLRRPPLSALTPSTAFRLMHTIAQLTNRPEPSGVFTYDGMTGAYVRSQGPVSDGLHVFASHGLDAGSQEVEQATRVARAFGAVCHQFSTPAVDEATPELVVSVGDDETLVEATVRQDGEERVGRASSTEATEAVATAILSARGAPYALEEIRDVELESGRAVVAVLTHEDGFLRLGLAITDRDLLQTAAIATLRALEQQV